MSLMKFIREGTRFIYAKIDVKIRIAVKQHLHINHILFSKPKFWIEDQQTWISLVCFQLATSSSLQFAIMLPDIEFFSELG